MEATYETAGNAKNERPLMPSLSSAHFGVLVPNRIFVGGISHDTTEMDLCRLFSTYGQVKSTRVIVDRAGYSKGYGFVTFESEVDARRLQDAAECLILRDRKLNIAPAIKKRQMPPRPLMMNPQLSNINFPPTNIPPYEQTTASTNMFFPHTNTNHGTPMISAVYDSNSAQYQYYNTPVWSQYF